MPVATSPSLRPLVARRGLRAARSGRAPGRWPLASCLRLARMRNSSAPTSVSFRLTSSTSSASALGRMISSRLLPILRIGMSLTPSGSIRCFSAEISSSMLKLDVQVLLDDLVDEDRPAGEVDAQLQLLRWRPHREQARERKARDHAESCRWSLCPTAKP